MLKGFAQFNGEDDCSKYKNLPIEMTFVNPEGLKLDLSADYKGVAPHIDSIWITTRYGNNAPHKIFSIEAQWGDIISLTPLLGCMESAYMCKIWIEDCTEERPFFFSGWCDDFEDVSISFTVINPHAIILHLEDTVSGIVPSVDSMWITSTAYRGFPEALVSGYAQSGDTIDIAPLVGMQEIVYLCWLRIGDCLKNGRFFFSGEEWDYCLEYADCYLLTDVTINVLRYSLTNTDQFENFHVDSVWVSSLYEPDVPLLVSDAQPEEDIVLSTLDQGEYLFSIQIGECVKRVQFYKHAQAEHESINTPDTPSYATKILRDGNLYILRGEKTFTITGAEVK